MKNANEVLISAAGQMRYRAEEDLICTSLTPEVMMLLAAWLEEEAKTIPPEADTSKWGPIEEAPAVAFALKYLEGTTYYL